MHLFDRIPDTFFTVLSSPNKNIYIDCIFIIYDATNSIEDSFQGERSFVVSKLIDYFEELEGEFEEGEQLLSTPRQKSNAVINVLKEHGWLGEEEIGDYKTSLNFFDYSIQIIDLLKRIARNEQIEYTGEIFTIYSLLQSFELADGLTILEQAYNKADDVLRKLKTLRANIYRFYYDLVQKRDDNDNLQLILDKLLVDYKENFFDNAYYKLKTTDSLPRYKRIILERINDIYQNEKYLDELTNQVLLQNKIPEYNDAFNYVEEKIRFIKDAMDAIEYLIQSIDEKNELYINAAASKIMFLTNSSEDFEGLINRLFKIILKEKEFDYTNIFNLSDIRNVDSGSLFTIRRRRVEPEPEIIDYDYDIPDDIKERKIAQLTKANIYSKIEINKHVKYLLNGESRIKASEVLLETNEDFVKLILVFLYSKSVDVIYDVRLLNYQARIGNIRFNEFEIFRRGK